MASLGQFRRDTLSRWNSVNPILAQGELGLVLDNNYFKIGDGTSYWTGLTYCNQGPSGATGATGQAGKGYSTTTGATLNFGDELYETDVTILNSQVTSGTTIMVNVTGDDFIVQGVTAGVYTITPGVGYTVWAKAQDGASGVMTAQLVIFI